MLAQSTGVCEFSRPYRATYLEMPEIRWSRLTHAPAIAALTSSLLAACAVGPNFKPPPAPQVHDYTAAPPPSELAGAKGSEAQVQHFVPGSDISADWWTLFHSVPLNELIEESVKNNPDLKAAQAALLAARETTLAQRGAFYPSVAASFDASRQRQSGQISPTPDSNVFLYNLFTPQVTISYVPDVFGLNRRTMESVKAQEQEVRFQMIAAYTTLTSNVVVAAIQQGSLQRQIEVTREVVKVNAHMLEILKFQFAKGYVGRLEVAAQESQLAQVAATLPPLLKQAAQLRDQLAVLTGHFPSEARVDDFVLSSLQLPQELPVSLPSELVAQRPDVLQAESNLHDASAKIGVAVANRLPNITLSANVGSTSVAWNQLFTTGTGFWGFGGTITAPIFQGGTLLHQERAARAVYTQAAEQYRSTVLSAFQNVADTLTALEQDADGMKAAADAAEALRGLSCLVERGTSLPAG
jgi:NodT family efflux transporter outer membrane factor (OMF) lipoprotein